MKALIEFIPVIVFLAVYWITQDIMLATKYLMGATAIAVLLSWLILKKVEKMLWFVLIAVWVFGGATLIFQDGIFIKIKPTVINYIFAVVCLGSHFIGSKKPIFQRLLVSKLNLPQHAWYRISYLWIITFVIAGSSNWFVLFNYPEEVWVNFRLFGLLSITMGAIILQSIYLMQLSKKYKILP